MILYLSADQPGKDTLVLEKKVGRPTTNSPSRRVHQTVLILTYHQCPSEIAAFKRDCGWRLYATNTKSCFNTIVILLLPPAPCRPPSLHDNIFT
jgi:hypothetical protein